jgi:hypothetical protein
MTAASHYLPNLRDVFFNLFEVLGIDRGVLGAGPFASFDADTARASLEGLAEFCTTTWSRSFVEGDQQGVAFDGAGAVTLPKGFTAALEAYYRDGWNTRRSSTSSAPTIRSGATCRTSSTSTGAARWC